jgi:hypothetical protein
MTMQIEIFTICDNAQVYAGKAVVMGAFNQVKAKKLPVVVPNLTLAVRVSFEKEESGDKTFYFFINKPDGTPLVPELRCETKQLAQPENQDQLTTYDLNIVLGNVSLNQFGCYTVTMRYEEKDFLLKFYVQKVK